MSFCLLPEAVEKFKQGLKSGELNPETLSDMTSEGRRALFEKFVGSAAEQVNALFESKLILKNQKAGYIAWAKKVAKLTPEVRRDLISRINKLDKALSAKEENVFLEDLVSTKFGINVTEAEAQTIFDLTRKIQASETKANKDGVFADANDRVEYGTTTRALENYMNRKKLEASSISFKEQPAEALLQAVKSIPGVFKSSLSTFDNSLWGRQGFKNLADPKTTKIWAKGFAQSFVNIGKQIMASGKWYESGDDAVMDMAMASIYSRPNAVNGKYAIGDFGLNVLAEEVYPSSFGEKIPLLGRFFKASEVAYKVGAVTMRADLADMMIELAEKNGINTRSREEMQPIGRAISSWTGRGNLGDFERGSNKINVFLFSIKFLQSNIDTLVAPMQYATRLGLEKVGVKSPEFTFKNKGEKFARKQAATKTLRILATVTTVLTVAKLLNPDNVEEDPRSANFGKVKIFGLWTDITGGMAGLAVLAARLVPTYHDGKWSNWTKSSSGEYKDLQAGGFGTRTALDVFDSFYQGKLSPFAGLVRDYWAGKDYQGNPFSLYRAVPKLFLPLSVQNYGNLKDDPRASFVLGSIILDGLGFSVSTAPEPNSKTKLIPLDQKIKKGDFISTVLTYAAAINTDPEVAVDRMLKGQAIVEVNGQVVIVARQSVEDSEAFKRKFAQDNNMSPEDVKILRLDHTIPNKLGGEEAESNWKVIPEALWKSYTPVEVALIKGVEEGNIELKEAQKMIVDFKSTEDKEQRTEKGIEIRKKYGGYKPKPKKNKYSKYY